MQKLICTILLLSLFYSCTIEKRVFLPGYSIHWKKKIVSEKNNQRTFSEEAPNQSNRTLHEDTNESQPEQHHLTTDTVLLLTPELANTTPQTPVNKEVQLPNQFIKNPSTTMLYRTVTDESAQEPATKPAKTWQACIAILLGIASGIGLYIPGLILLAILFRGKKSEIAVANRKPDDQKTFRWIFLSAFLLTVLLSMLVGFTALFVFMALAISYYGLLWIIAILMVVSALLIWLSAKGLVQSLRFLYPFRASKKATN
jgi:hypothetical protein